MKHRAAVFCVAFSFAAAFATYAYSAPLVVGVWDTAEIQTVPYVLGIAHPTGFPLFTLAGWAFTHVFALGGVAWRMNVLSALCVAIAAGATALLALVLGSGAFEAFIGAMLFAWCSAVWNKGSHADPHAMSLMFVVLVLVAAVIYARSGSARALVAACSFGGLGLATQPEVLWSLPAILVALFVRRLPAPRAVALAFAALVLPLAFYAYLPLRSAYVVAHHLDPDAAPPTNGISPSLLDTNHTSTADGFIDEVSGRQFGASGAVMAFFAVQRYPAVAAYWWEHANDQLPMPVILLGFAGAIGLAVRSPRLTGVVLAGTLGALPFVFAYKDVEGDPNRYFLPSFALIAALAATSSGLPIPRSTQSLRSIVVSVLLLVCLDLQFMRSCVNGFAARRDTGGTGTIATVQSEIPDGAIVVAGWVDATPLEYAEFVDHSLGSRTIVIGWPGAFRDQYASWVRSKPVYILADNNTMGNIRATLPASMLDDRPSADGYHRIIRVLGP